MRFAALLFIPLVLVACGGGDLTVLAPAELPPDLYAASPAAPAGDTQRVSRTLPVYFVRGDRLARTEMAAEAAGSSLESALQVLVQGPDSADAAAGLSSVMPPGVQVLGASVKEGVASVNLSREFEAPAEEHVLTLRVAQVVYTATEVAGVERVSFQVEGEPVNVLAGPGDDPGEGVRREDFSHLAPAGEG